MLLETKKVRGREKREGRRKWKRWGKKMEKNINILTCITSATSISSFTIFIRLKRWYPLSPFSKLLSHMTQWELWCTLDILLSLWCSCFLALVTDLGTAVLSRLILERDSFSLRIFLPLCMSEGLDFFFLVSALWCFLVRLCFTSSVFLLSSLSKYLWVRF